MLMLVDTGASPSIISRSFVSNKLSTLRHHLVGVGGASISCYDSRMVPLQFQRRHFVWDLEVVNMNKPILGDFLTANKLLVDLQRGLITSHEDQHLLLP